MGREDAEREAESRQLEELYKCFKALDDLQTTFSWLAKPDERDDAEGRRCILSVSGLKYNQQKSIFFEVSNGRVQMVEPYEEYSTYIVAPIDSVIRVLSGVIEGDEDVFAKEWARGKASITGQRHVHDAIQFTEAFRRFARLCKQYRPARQS